MIGFFRKMMELFEIKRNPNVTGFFIKRSAGGDWNIYVVMKIDEKEIKACVKTQRGPIRDFKTLDNAVKFIEDCGKTDRVTVMINAR